MNLLAVFLTGLTTGGLSCLAMQGGLLASVIANQKEDELSDLEKNSAPGQVLTKQARRREIKNITPIQTKNLSPSVLDDLDWMPVSLFLISKLVVHTLFGFLLGWLGSKIEFDLTLRLIFQGAAALFMLATAGNLLNLHPIFRYVVFQPPKFIQRLVRNSTKGKAFFTPIILGMMTIFIPCGVTQAMEVLAITSGNALLGGLIMFLFVLGTSPLFALVGVATAKLSETFKVSFMKIAAATLIFLGLSSLNGILVVVNSPITFETITQPISYFFSEERFTASRSGNQAEVIAGAQQLLIQVNDNGYSPRKLQVKSGIPVQLTLQTNNSYTCASSFVLNAFNIRLQLGPTDKQTVSFTPTQKGKFPFSCSMGMYTGVLEVI